MKNQIIFSFAIILGGFCSGCKTPSVLTRANAEQKKPSLEQPAGLISKGTSKALTEFEVSERVAVELMSWGILGPIPQLDPEYTQMEKSVIRKIHGVRGFSESDDFHGDGTDWYEVDLTPEIATELRAAFKQSPAFKNTRPVFFNNAPSWWPAHLPADAQIYNKDLEYFVLPDSGTRAWFMRIRT